MSPSGHADWNVDFNVNLNQIQNINDLVMRLEGAVSYEQTGQLLFLDSFNHQPVRWIKTLGAAGSYVGSDTEEGHSNEACVKLSNGSVVGGSAKITKYFPYDTTGKYGVEFLFRLCGSDGNLRFDFGIDDGIHKADFYILFGSNYQNTSVYGNVIGISTLFPGSPMLYDPLVWTRFKLVVDYQTSEFTMFRMGQSLNVGSAGNLDKQSALTYTPKISMSFRHASDSTPESYALVDSVLLTFEK